MKTYALVFVALCSLARAASNPDEPFTAKELAQGFRDHVILARPHAARRASADAEEAREGVRVREKFARFRDLRVIDLESTDSAQAAITRLRATGRYEFVEPDYIRHLAAEPNDPQFTDGSLWGLKNTGQNLGIAGADIKATQAWDLIHDAPNVIVAVVDTGVNLNHQDIAPNLWRNPSPTFGDVNGARFVNGQQSGNPSDDNGHGTHVAGTIGAVGDNGIAVAGVAWKVQIMAVKVFPASGGGSVSDIARGVNYAVAHGAHIINASYGEEGSTGFSNTELAAITAAREAGIIFVAAAGNAAANMDVSRFYPASHALENMVTVGNSTRRDELSRSSNYGAAVDLFAPGEEIVSLDYRSTTGTISFTGTSMAAPHVSGALALLKARFPADTYRQLINRLLRGVDSGGRFAGKAGTSGRLNLFAALNTTTNRPFNDDFASRPHFTSENLAIRTSNAGATAEPGEPAQAGIAASSTLWWEWVAPGNSAVSIDTTGSSYDTVLAVYTGASLGALTPVAANDDDGGNRSSRVNFLAEAGVTYQIAVGGKGGQGGLTLMNLGTMPANDSFASPVAIAGESTRITATNAHCTREAGEPRIGNYNGGTSLWYRWTAPRSARFQISVASTDFDPIMAVYTGTQLNALTLVDPTLNATANDKSAGALWTVNAIAGTSYLITVDSKNASVVGQFTLSLTDALWQLQVGNSVTGSPAIARDGTVYFGSTDRSVYALAPEGTVKWSFATGGLVDTCSPAVAEDGTVYIGSFDAKLYALNPNGTQKWSHDFGSNNTVSNSPSLAADGTIYVKPADGQLYALNPADGTTKWRFAVNGFGSYGSAAIAPDGTIYQGSDDKKLYAINPDGTLKWAFTGDNDIYTTPAIDAAGNLYFSVLNTGKLFSVAPGGTKRWEYAGAKLGSSSSACLSPDGRTVYFGGYDALLHAVDTSTGAARWTAPLGDEVRASSPAVDANGVVYIGCYDYRLYAINPDGTRKRTWDTGNVLRSSPVIFGRTLYVGSNDHKFYAFDIGALGGAGPWPQYRHNPRRTGRAVTDVLTIDNAPRSQVAVLGGPLSLSVLAAGDAPLAYQWFKDGVAIAGASGASYTVNTVAARDAGRYTVRVSGPRGTVTSEAAVVTVEEASVGRLINLAVRTATGADGQTLIVGFVTRGGEQRLLVRGVGPGLIQFGVSGALAAPRLQLAGGSGLLAENDNWGGDAAIAQAAAASGAFPLDPASRDAALVRTIGPGSYTAQVAGINNASGIALAEIYDLQAGGTTGNLINLSARAQVGTGSSILIAGFAVSGNVSRRVLVRAVGPSLAQFGVTGRLADPKLEVFRGPTKVAENDDWASGGAAALTAAFAQAGAFTLNSVSSFDSALVVTVPAGSYTAQVSGTSGTTGIALVEIYDLGPP